MDEAHDYRFGPVLTVEPEPDASASAAEADGTPVQSDIAATADQNSVKPQIRAEVRAKRDALSDKERAAGTRRIVERLLLHPDVHRARTVLLFASYGSEVHTDDLAKELMKRGKAVAFPKITSVAGLMTLWRIKHLDALIPHKHGIRAPDVTRSQPIEPITVDCVIYPGLAFTKGLSRLGQGGGYYDRLSTKIADNCARIGVCFETQLVNELPQEAHDAKVHWVVTEVTVYPFVPDPPVVAPPAIPVGAALAAISGSDAASDAPIAAEAAPTENTAANS